MDNQDLQVLEELDQLVVIQEGKAVIAPVLAYNLKMAEQQINAIKEFQENYKKKILQIMEEKGIYKIDNDILTITYTAPTTSSRFDSARLKKENPELYEQYKTISDVSSSIKIKCK